MDHPADTDVAPHATSAPLDALRRLTPLVTRVAATGTLTVAIAAMLRAAPPPILPIGIMVVGSFGLGLMSAATSTLDRQWRDRSSGGHTTPLAHRQAVASTVTMSALGTAPAMAALAFTVGQGRSLDLLEIIWTRLALASWLFTITRMAVDRRWRFRDGHLSP